MNTHSNLPYGETATRFAQALVAGRYDDAHSMLATNLQTKIARNELRARYEQMVEYGTGPVTVDGFTQAMDDWPDKHDNDAGWVYVSISGEDYAEAVTVIVSVEGEELKIRDIEWGRP